MCMSSARVGRFLLGSNGHFRGLPCLSEDGRLSSEELNGVALPMPFALAQQTANSFNPGLRQMASKAS